MLRVGAVLHGTYRIGSYLSSGGFGNTYVATNFQLDEVVAIKEFFIKGTSKRENGTTNVSISVEESREIFNKQLAKFKKEAQRLRKLNNPHIISVHDLFDENGTAYYAMDFVDGENLSETLKRTKEPFSEEKVYNIFCQVIDALHDVHQANLLHLDLKPANIMMDKQGRIKLIDFGASKQCSSDGATTSSGVCYTNGYAPTEQMEGNIDKFGPWTDFYALGATLYTLLTTKTPPLPTDISEDETPDKHVSLPFPSNISNWMKDLVLWLLQTSRLRRPQSVDDIYRWQKEHTGIIWNNIYNTHADEDVTIRQDSHNGDTIKKPSVQPAPPTQPEPMPTPTSGTGKGYMSIIIGLIIGLGALFVGMIGLKTCNGTERATAADSTVVDTVSISKANNETINIPQGICVYTGDLNDKGMPDGEGEAHFKDGRVYKGTFVDGKLQGNGYFVYDNGDTFSGSFVNDHFDTGKYTIKQDGSYFVGSFNKSGQPQAGTWYDKNDQILQTVKSKNGSTSTSKQSSSKTDSYYDYTDYAVADSCA